MIFIINEDWTSWNSGSNELTFPMKRNLFTKQSFAISLLDSRILSRYLTSSKYGRGFPWVSTVKWIMMRQSGFKKDDTLTKLNQKKNVCKSFHLWLHLNKTSLAQNFKQNDQLFFTKPKTKGLQSRSRSCPVRLSRVRLSFGLETEKLVSQISDFS